VQGRALPSPSSSSRTQPRPPHSGQVDWSTVLAGMRGIVARGNRPSRQSGAPSAYSPETFLTGKPVRTLTSA